MRSGIFKEATVVGGSLFVVGAALMQFRQEGITDKKYWPYLGVFITGFSAHLIFEAFGLNKKYCDVAFSADPDDWDEEIDWDNDKSKKDDDLFGEIEWDAETPVEYHRGRYYGYGNVKVKPHHAARSWADWSNDDFYERFKDKTNNQPEITEFEKEMIWIENIFITNRYFCNRYEDVPYLQRKTFSGNNLRRGNRCYNCRSKECPSGLLKWKEAHRLADERDKKRARTWGVREELIESGEYPDYLKIDRDSFIKEIFDADSDDERIERGEGEYDSYGVFTPYRDSIQDSIRRVEEHLAGSKEFKDLVKERAKGWVDENAPLMNNRYFCKKYEDLPISERRTFSGKNLRRGNRCYNCRSKDCPDRLIRFKRTQQKIAERRRKRNASKAKEERWMQNVVIPMRDESNKRRDEQKSRRKEKEEMSLGDFWDREKLYQAEGFGAEEKMPYGVHVENHKTTSTVFYNRKPFRKYRGNRHREQAQAYASFMESKLKRNPRYFNYYAEDYDFENKVQYIIFNTKQSRQMPTHIIKVRDTRLDSKTLCGMYLKGKSWNVAGVPPKFSSKDNPSGLCHKCVVKKSESFEADDETQAYLMCDWNKKVPYEIHNAGCKHRNFYEKRWDSDIDLWNPTSLEGVCRDYIQVWEHNLEGADYVDGEDLDAIAKMTFSQFMRSDYTKTTTPIKLSPCHRDNPKIKQFMDNTLVGDISPLNYLRHDAESFEADSNNPSAESYEIVISDGDKVGYNIIKALDKDMIYWEHIEGRFRIPKGEEVGYHIIDKLNRDGVDYMVVQRAETFEAYERKRSPCAHCGKGVNIVCEFCEGCRKCCPPLKSNSCVGCFTTLCTHDEGYSWNIIAGKKYCTSCKDIDDDTMSAETFEAEARKCGVCRREGHTARQCVSENVPFSKGGFWREYGEVFRPIPNPDGKRTYKSLYGDGKRYQDGRPFRFGYQESELHFNERGMPYRVKKTWSLDIHKGSIDNYEDEPYTIAEYANFGYANEGYNAGIMKSKENAPIVLSESSRLLPLEAYSSKITEHETTSWGDLKKQLKGKSVKIGVMEYSVPILKDAFKYLPPETILRIRLIDSSILIITFVYEGEGWDFMLAPIITSPRSKSSKGEIKNKKWWMFWRAEEFEADSCRECGRKEGAYSNTVLVACEGCPELCCQHCLDEENNGCAFCIKKRAESTSKGLNLVMMGVPGSGKGTQSKLITKAYGWPQIGMGDLIRDNMKRKTPLGKKCEPYMATGSLVPDEVMIELVSQRLKEDDCKEGFILDGFPRTVPQGNALEKITNIDAVFFLDSKEEVVIERLGGRRTCSDCGEIYHQLFQPPKQEGVCDLCNGDLFIRPDDNIETIMNRLSVFNKETEPLINFYTKRNLLKNIESNSTPQDVFEKIEKIIKGMLM